MADDELEVVKNPTYQDQTELGSDGVTLLFPKSLLLARLVLRINVSVVIYWLMPILEGICWGTGAVLQSDASSELSVVFDVCAVFASFSISALVHSLARAVAVDGGLAKLGLDGVTQISAMGRRRLRRWMFILSFFGFVFTLFGLIQFVTASKVGQRSRITGRLLTPTYIYSVILPNAVVLFFYFPHVMMNWIYALQYGGILVGEEVAKVTRAMESLKPTDPEWQTQVVDGIKTLVNVTLPRLSHVFGNALGCLTLGLWSVSLGMFANYLENRRLLGLFLMLILTFLPFGIATTVSDTSDRCDKLRDTINKKRIQDLGLHLELAALETCMNNENRGQGLGFVVFGIVIDITMMNKIFSTLVSFLITVVPIILALHQPTLHRDMSVECELSAIEVATIKGLMGRANSTCSFNVTIDDILAL